jgi:tetratricopeptide (TPR) repeat protein
LFGLGRPALAQSKTRLKETEASPAGLERAVRGLAPALLLVWLLYLVALGPPNYNARVFDATLSLHGLYALLGLAFAAQLLLGRRLPGPTAVDWPVAALVCAYAAATAWSVDSRLSAEAALLVGVTVVAVYVLHDLRALTAPAMVRTFVVFALVLALLALFDLFGRYQDWRHLLTAVGGKESLAGAQTVLLTRPHGLIDHPLRLAMVLNLALPFAVLLALRPSASADRVLGLSLIAFGSAALLFTLSRGAWMGTIAAVPVFVVLYGLRYSNLRRLDRAFAAWRRPLVLGGVAAGALLVSVLALALPSASARLLLARDTLSPRLDSLSTASRIIADRPLLGGGPYTYPLLYTQSGGSDPTDSVHAHNLLLNLLTDTGIAGTGAFLAAGVLLALAVRGAYFSGDAAQRTWLAACVAALTTYAVHSLTDSPLTYNHALLPLAPVLALTLRFAAPGMPAPGRHDILPRLLVLALLPALVAGHYLADQAHGRYDQSLRSLATGRVDEAAVHGRAAAGADPSLAAYQFHAGVVTVVAAQQTGDPDPSALDSARLYLQRGLQLDPNSALGHANLAQVQVLQGALQGAVSSARAALATSRVDVTIDAVAATVLEQAGEREEAIAAYGRAIKQNPSLSQSAFWSASPERLALRAEAVAASGLNACRLGRPAVLYGAYGDDIQALEAACREVAAGGDSLARADLALLLHALGRSDEAMGEAQAAIGGVSSQRAEQVAVRTAWATVIAPSSDARTVRRELLTAAYLADPDARVLLAWTYAAPGHEMALRLGLPVEGNGVPAAIRGLINSALRRPAPVALAEPGQYYRIGINYYRLTYLREAPAYLFVPGEWQQLVSPRTLALRAAVGE